MTNWQRPSWLPGSVAWCGLPDRQELAEALAKRVSDILARRITEQGRCALAVSGGSTPLAFFSALSCKPMAWSGVTVALVDERFVPPTHCDSNERLVREHLLVGEAALAKFLGMVNPKLVQQDDLESNLLWAENAYRSLPEALDVTILGMGNDGHTASLFPGAAALAGAQAPDNPHWLSKVEPLSAPHRRITLNAAVILRSRDLMLHIVGEDKLHTLQAALSHNDVRKTPIVQFLEANALQRAPLTIYWSP